MKRALSRWWCCGAPPDSDNESSSRAALRKAASGDPESSNHQNGDTDGVQAELGELGDVLRAISGIQGSSFYQLGRVCSILADHFRVPLLSIHVLSGTGITCLPMAAAGRLARLLPLGLPQFLDASQASSLYRVSGQQRLLSLRAPRDELPPDWASLRDTGALSAFIAAPIVVGTESLAVLTLAAERPEHFAAAMWPTYLQLTCACLAHLFKDRLLVSYCGVVEELMVVDSLDELVRSLSKCVVRLQTEKLHHTRLTCRIACVSHDGSSAIIFDEALGGGAAAALTSLSDMHGGGSATMGVGPHSAAVRAVLASRQAHGAGTLSPSASQHALAVGSGAASEGGSPGGAHLAAAPVATPRGRMARLSLLAPSPSSDPYFAALMLQQQLQMHSLANLVPDPVDPRDDPRGDSVRPDSPAGTLGLSGGGAGPIAAAAGGGTLGSGTPASPARLYISSHPNLPMPLHQLQSGAGAAPTVPASAGRLSMAAYGSAGPSLTGDAGREAAIWAAVDPGMASNFSQQPLQVEGQTYPTENTLLAEAIRNRAGVWIGDCVSFMQNPNNPNNDVFLAATTGHTTAMLLAVMWERSGAAGCGATHTGPTSTVVSSHYRPSRGRQTGSVLNRQITPTSLGPTPSHTATPLTTQHSASWAAAVVGAAVGGMCGGGGAAGQGSVQLFGSFTRQGGAGGGGGACGGGAGGCGEAGGGGQLRMSGGTASDLGVGRHAGGARQGDVPLLAFYILTSGAATPAALQDLLVSLRELLLVLEPLVSSKLGDELAEEWSHLQEMLERSQAAKHPRERTIVLRNTAAQLTGIPIEHPSREGAEEDQRGDVPMLSAVAGALPASPRPHAGSPRLRYQATHDDSGALSLGMGVGGGPGGEGSVRGGGEGSVRGGGEGSVRGGAEGRAMGFGSGNFGGAVGAKSRTPSFSVSKSFTGKRMSALISGVQDRVQQAQRQSLSYATMFSRPDDLRSIAIVDKLGSGGFGTVYLGTYQTSDVAVKVILERDCETEVLRNAVELAVLSTLSHPNIVQVLTFFTDVSVQVPPIQMRINGTAPPIVLIPHQSAETQFISLPHDLASAAVGSLAVGSIARDAVQGNSGPSSPLVGSAPCTSLLAQQGGGQQGGGQAWQPGGLQGPAGPKGGADGALGSPQRRQGTLAAALMAAGVDKGRQPPPRVLAVHGGREAEEPPAAGPPCAALSPGQAPRRALVIVMEYCDAGCLADAVRNGVFKEKVKGGYGALQPAWSIMYPTLLEVAQALRYLHSINLVHRDLKPQNVLLKSSPSDVRGFTAKLSDFGLVKLLTEADMMAAAAAANAAAQRRRRRYSGTITHVAPEALQPGGPAAGSTSLVDVSADIYSFGIMMWEVLTGQPVYMGLNSDQIIQKVQHEGYRPAFPSDTPSEYASLANKCWDPDPCKRPTAEELVQQLSSLSASTRGTAILPTRRRLSTLSNKELLRNVANANLAAANAAAAAGALGVLAGGGARGGPANMPLQPHVPRRNQQHNEDEFPLHIL